MENSHTYTLAELAGAFGLTERTARYYIEKVLPPHHKKGRGKVARYGQDTWNCFQFIMLVRERYGFGPSQVSGLLADIEQSTIDRVVRGEEELAVMSVPFASELSAGQAHSELPPASQRATRFRPRQRRKARSKQQSVQNIAYSLEKDSFLSEAAVSLEISADEAGAAVEFEDSAENVETAFEFEDSVEEVEAAINFEGSAEETEPVPAGDWQTLYADEELLIQSHQKKPLTHLQQEQIRTAAWVIKEVLGSA
jgi:DNA-binding transcriptional MerR regulator